VSKPITDIEIAEALEHRQKHVQDLYRHAMQRLSDNRDEYAAKKAIQDGNLVTRQVLNRKSKLDPKWDSPFVVVASPDIDVFQLSGPNGHILNHLVNSARLPKLSSSEVERYPGEFWQASERLKLHEQRAKEKCELQELEKKVAHTTIEVLEAQKQGKPTSLERHAELSVQRRKLRSVETQQAAQTLVGPTAPSTATRPVLSALPSHRPLRSHRLPVRFQE
jgi:hypothetical protein